MRIAVVTKVPTPDENGDLSGGNLALGEVYLDPQALGGKFTDPHQLAGKALKHPMLMLHLQTPVFRLGEILLLDGNDRDQFGRKPSKWDVEIEEFVVLDDKAAMRVREVTGHG